MCNDYRLEVEASAIFEGFADLKIKIRDLVEFCAKAVGEPIQGAYHRENPPQLFFGGAGRIDRLDRTNLRSSRPLHRVNAASRERARWGASFVGSYHSSDQFNAPSMNRRTALRSIPGDKTPLVAASSRAAS
jgi:hypothetical protein